MDYTNNEICANCTNGPFEKCNVSWDQITLDDITRKVVDCNSYDEKPKHRIKITYECEGRVAVEEKDVYDLPNVKWKKKAKAAAGLGEFQNVFISDEELKKLKRDFPNEYQDGIEALSEYIMISPQKAKKYKSHYAVIRKWLNGDRKKKKEREQEARERENRRNNKDKLSSKATYDLEKIKREAMNNTEL